MRSEKEMMNLILSIASEDERILAVYMNGSRVNRNAPKDLFQDYDIVYVVENTAPFVEEREWLDQFGKRLLMQEPAQHDEALGKNVNADRSYTYLMLLADGNRIDLHVETIASMRDEYENDSLTIALLDKRGILPDIPPASDRNYRVKKPTEAEFLTSCNEFWWCLQNVVKGIWRDELPYAKEMFDGVVRVPLNHMTSWWIQQNQNAPVATGKMGKYFKCFLPETLWEQYKHTYSGPSYEDFWRSLFIACDLFSTLARDVASQLTYPYNEEEEKHMLLYIRQVQSLSKEATEIFKRTASEQE
ncbi:aminoglycoside 6-adenylyltransferase [Shouchella lehensis]|uniref:Aminoglycoside 6-adenylyltransferase n=1 Tax=Shouchella lehensis TaxID=300825 RepID=A0A4Y7WMX4_9BACI|nr:aminoglycoside 6-adenylyltransferase [Shouchella lehensis]MBG9782928.1 aminoglycoside adenylyltransferase [Shouchella lehensis]RQW22866.1 aminoglycoside 6-adenylyltransferase [Bacillus sp. C1-1]TES49717.1 aminoglycoside 6-adenylyltransferase [Shouchella lehensis]